MATIEQRLSDEGKPSYRVKIRLKGHPTQTATFTRKTDAKRWAQQTETAIREGRYFQTIEASRHTVAELITRYIREVLPFKKSAQDQRCHLLWWKKEIGARLLSEITSATVAEYRDKLRSELTRGSKPRSGATANRYLSSLSHVFTIAVREWHWIEVNPVTKIRKLPESRGRVRFLSDNERRRLLDACKAYGEPLYTIVVLALSTGARRGEIMRLRWPDVDLPRGVITLHETKNGERRRLPLQSHALECVRQISKVHRLDTDLLFPSHRDPQRHLDIRIPFTTALAKAEIADFRFHDLRHSAASYLAMNGASLAEIAEVLGHKTLAMVKRYAHLSETHTTKVVAAMNDKIFS
jgi:integrase